MPKLCEACDKEIGDNDAKCPACGVVFEELNDAVSAVEKANAILEKRRKKKEEDAKCKKCGKIHEGACAPIKKPSPFSALGSALRRKG